MTERERIAADLEAEAADRRAAELNAQRSLHRLFALHFMLEALLKALEDRPRTWDHVGALVAAEHDLQRVLAEHGHPGLFALDNAKALAQVKVMVDAIAFDPTKEEPKR